ncbi:MAG: P-type conjugative transfer protein TrbL [Acidobacteria bacterium]|nr:P-type conjugative transfer protein TrbL [Acidobacteriota bacterium]
MGAIPLFGQTYAQSPGDLLDQYRTLRPTWFAAAAGAANRLFGILALIEFAWSAAVLVMERTDLQGWTSGLIKRMMFVGAFYALLVNGRTWIPAIIDSFEIIGQNAAGVGGGLSPGDIFIRGLDIADQMLTASSLSGFLTNIAGSLALVLGAFITFLAFVVVCVHYVMALVESYVVVGAGFIFLGFGGSRWTAPYVERYIALAVAVGVKIMVLYLLVGAGMTISAGWVARATSLGTLANPIMSALDIVGGAIIFMALCWQAPKFTASLLGGSPAFSGGDVAAVGLAGAQTAFVVGSLGAGAMKLLAARGAAAGAMSVSQAAGMGAGGSSAAGGAGAAGGGSGMPGSGAGGGRGSSGSPSGGSGGTSGNVGAKGSSGQPAPPSSNPAGTPGSGSAGGSNGSSSSAKQANGQKNGGGPSTANAPTMAANDNPQSASAPPSVGTGTHPKSSNGRQVAAPSAARVGIAGNAANDAVFQSSEPGAVAMGGSATQAKPPRATRSSSGGLDSPQTVSLPMTNSSPMDLSAPMTVGDGQPSPPTQSPSKGTPVQQSASPNATLENPQTIESPQTVNAPMANSSPMTNSAPMADQTVNRPQSQVPPPSSNLAERLENQFDRAAQRTAMLRQALPADGHGGSPAPLNLNGGE